MAGDLMDDMMNSISGLARVSAMLAQMEIKQMVRDAEIEEDAFRADMLIAEADYEWQRKKFDDQRQNPEVTE